MNTWQGSHSLDSAPRLAPVFPRTKTINLELHILQPTQMCIAALSTIPNSKVPETCLTPPCPFSGSKAQCPCTWANQSSKRNTIHVWYQNALQDDAGGKVNGMASEASHFYQTLGIRSQPSITSTFHAQVYAQVHKASAAIIHHGISTGSPFLLKRFIWEQGELLFILGFALASN